MTNPSTDSQTGRSRRYSVSRLLELAPQTRIINFDLSKFSYDAARAGVVPPLGACAMSTRRTVSDRPRNWSQESSSSQEELIVYRGNRIVKEPERQPIVPPTGDLAQQDEGFARFLKKHSSPTHQRVTAGGRIVPMEQRPRPPPFSLPHAKQDTDSARKDNTDNTGQDAGSPFPPLMQDMSQQGKSSQDGVDGQVIQPPVHMLANTNVMPAAINVNLMAYPDAYAIDATSCQPPFSPGLMTAPLFPSMYDPFGMTGAPVYSPSPLAITAPLTGFSGNMEAPFPMSMLAQPEVPYVPALDAMPAPQTGHKLGEELHSNKMLQVAIARFNDLDQQLKNLDRHRAMGDHDPQLVGQRMIIVQMRAEAKTTMNYWTGIVSNDLKVLGQQAADRPPSTLNVQAAAYVPLNPTGDTGGSQAMRKNSPKPGRRRIPIVAPPEKLSSAEKCFKDDPTSDAGDVEVDEWGSRIGEPPEDIQRQQSEMLLQLTRELSISPQESTHGSAAMKAGSVTPLPPLTSSPIKDQPFDTDPAQDGDSELANGEWLPTQPGRAPASVEACYEIQLDAMRLPKGFITKVQLPDGTVTEVRGQGLRRPPSFEMDDFERRYWTNKPELTEQITANFLEVRLAVDEVPANPMDKYADFNRTKGESHGNYCKENALVVAKNSMESLGGKQTNLGAGDRLTRPLVPPRFGRQAYTSIMTTSTDSEGMFNFGPTPSFSPNSMSRADNKAGWSNVHAMGRLPHMLDGATDNQRRTAASMLSAAGRGRSPQIMHGVTAGANVHYGGPQDGEIGGVILENDDMFRPSIVKQGDM